MGLSGVLAIPLFYTLVLGFPLLLPVIVPLHFFISITILLQSIVTRGPLSESWMSGRLLARCLTKVQSWIDMCLAMWFVLFNLIILLPLGLFYFLGFIPLTLYLGHMFVVPKFCRRAVLAPVRLVAPRDEADLVDTVPKALVVVYRLISGSGASIATALLRLLSWSRWAPTRLSVPASRLDRLLWNLANSDTGEALALGRHRLRAKMALVLRAVESSAVVLLVVPNLMGKYLEVQFFFTQQALMFVWHPLLLPVLLGSKLSDAAADLDSQWYTRQLQRQSGIYAALPVVAAAAACGSPQAQKIRVLRITPGRRTAALVCVLQVIDLADQEHRRPSYEALSYVWGRPLLSQRIQVNGQPYWVTESVYQVLCRLRRPRSTRTVWIDALCVNQADFAERGAQVLLMTRVYEEATRTIVWLGEKAAPWGSASTLRPLSCSDQLHRRGRDYGQMQGGPGGGEQMRKIGYGDVRVISQILKNPWWTRVWVIQELVLARQVVMCCGPHSITWDNFCRLVDACASKPYFSKTHGHYSQMQALRAERAKRFTSTPASLASSSLPPPPRPHNGIVSVPVSRMEYCSNLLSAIFEFRGRQATESRDRVFALQGLVPEPNLTPQDRKTHPTSPFCLIRPDYTRLPSFLSLELAWACIRETRSLSIVALAECARQTFPSAPDSTNDNRYTYVPSWCPAFMNREAVTQGLQWRPFWTGLPGARKGNTSFSAAGHLPVQEPAVLEAAIVLEDPSDEAASQRLQRLPIHVLRELRAEITQVGPVAGVSAYQLGRETLRVMNREADSFMQSFSARVDWRSVLAEWWEMAAREARRRRRRDRGSPDSGGPRSDEPTDETPCWVAEFCRTVTGGVFSVPPRHLPLTPPPLESTWGRKRPAEAELAFGTVEDAAYREALEATCRNRRLFITADGRLGLGPSEVQVGDEVDVLIGSQVPMVLRLAMRDKSRESMGYGDQDWLYVGQAYVHDLMEYKGGNDVREDIERGRVALERRVLV